MSTMFVMRLKNAIIVTSVYNINCRIGVCSSHSYSVISVITFSTRLILLILSHRTSASVLVSKVSCKFPNLRGSWGFKLICPFRTEVYYPELIIVLVGRKAEMPPPEENGSYSN